nr:hypothetical protein [Microbulbifer guangxiensis]
MLAGANAARQIREEGLRAERVSTLIGASGGPKWLVISQLDRVLIGEFFRDRKEPVVTLGSSIGSFRNMCYAMDDPLAALERLEYGYVNQVYDSGKPTPDEITAQAGKILEGVLGSDGARQVAGNNIWQSHFVTVRGRGPLASERRAVLAPALLTSALANAFTRRSLSAFWDRVVFHAGSESRVGFRNLRTVDVPLNEDNVCPAVLASGSIPLVMAGIRDPHGAPRGNYRDGGITDYHFDLGFERPPGLALYPHFFPYMVPGWFDKSLSWRWVRGGAMADTLLVAPSPGFVADLPFGKIPDRDDFVRLSTAERLKYWHAVIDASQRVAEDFHELWQTGRIPDQMIEVGADDVLHRLPKVSAA